MKRILSFKILVLIIATIFFHSCKKEDKDVPGAHYTIYLDKQNRILKRIEGTASTTSYEYTNNTVKVWDCCYRHTYFLNSNGLADSCLVEDLSYVSGWEKPFMLYFRYNQDGWKEDKGYLYKYVDGNRTEAIQDTTFFEHYRRSDYYSFTSLPNIIDLEYFGGPYLGKYNTNLISKLTYSIGSLFKDATVEFSYTLDKKDYVIKRTEIFTAVGFPTHESIRTYKYIFVDQ